MRVRFASREFSNLASSIFTDFPSELKTGCKINTSLTRNHDFFGKQICFGNEPEQIDSVG